MPVTEQLANLSWQWVLLIVVILFGVRYAFLKQGGEASRNVAEIAESLAIAMALVFFLIRPFFVQAFFIPSGSMLPTLKIDDHILVNKLEYRFIAPKTGDVIVFKCPPQASEDGSQKDYIKRLIGTPGDTVQVKAGLFEIAGQPHYRAEIENKFLQGDEIGDENVHCKYVPGGVMLNGRKITIAQIAKAFDTTPDQVTIRPGRTILNGKTLTEPYTAEDPDYDMAPVKVKPGYLFVMGDNRNNSNDSHKWGQLKRWRVIGKAMFIFWPLNRIRIIR